MAKLIKVDDLTYLPLHDTCMAMGGEIRDFYAYPFGAKHPVRDKQEVFPKSKRKIQAKAKIIILTSEKSSQSLDYVSSLSEKGELNADILEVFLSQEVLLKNLSKMNPDIILVLNYKQALDKNLLEKARRQEITVLNFVPTLIDNKLPSKVRTSRGIIPNLGPQNSIKESFQKNLPVSGFSLYQVLQEALRFVFLSLCYCQLQFLLHSKIVAHYQLQPLLLDVDLEAN